MNRAYLIDEFEERETESKHMACYYLPDGYVEWLEENRLSNSGEREEEIQLPPICKDWVKGHPCGAHHKDCGDKPCIMGYFK